MDNKPSVDRTLFIPALVGGFSVLGIVLVLLALRLGASQKTVPTEPTNTPVKYQFLATEPVVAQPTEAPPAGDTTATATATPTEIVFDFEATSTPTFSTAVPTLAPTNTRAINTSTTTPLDVTYDDADPVFTHTGNWIAQTNVSGAYKNTLHISSTIGDFAQLSFYGQKIRLTYQAGPSLGTVAIRLDSTDFVLDQSADESQSMEWESPVLTLANHQITITHISGGSINLDSLIVIDIATPTPTFTPPP
jgi:hypothetical protein